MESKTQGSIKVGVEEPPAQKATDSDSLDQGSQAGLLSHHFMVEEINPE